jgi:DNA-binding HxlR family transcriptional regulator
MAQLPAIISLFHHRWAVPVIAEVGRTRGSKVITVLHALGVARDSLRRTLLALAEQQLVVRNPGYGHPMRPELVLTPDGERIAAACLEIVRETQALAVEDLAFQKWSLPVLAALADGAGRFGELKTALAGISPRALTLTLKDLAESGLIVRSVVDGYPPTTVYALTPKAHRLAALVSELA